MSAKYTYGLIAVTVLRYVLVPSEVLEVSNKTVISFRRDSSSEAAKQEEVVAKIKEEPASEPDDDIDGVPITDEREKEKVSVDD